MHVRGGAGLVEPCEFTRAALDDAFPAVERAVAAVRHFGGERQFDCITFLNRHLVANGEEGLAPAGLRRPGRCVQRHAIGERRVEPSCKTAERSFAAAIEVELSLVRERRVTHKIDRVQQAFCGQQPFGWQSEELIICGERRKALARLDDDVVPIDRRDFRVCLGGIDRGHENFDPRWNNGAAGLEKTFACVLQYVRHRFVVAETGNQFRDDDIDSLVKRDAPRIAMNQLDDVVDAFRLIEAFGVAEDFPILLDSVDARRACLGGKARQRPASGSDVGNDHAGANDLPERLPVRVEAIAVADIEKMDAGVPVVGMLAVVGDQPHSNLLP